uniref:Uncharacterized protein n=1 Tax=Arundo donax TaxID=35708 RepID=A0A0A9H3C7_ARUDO
MRLKSSNYSLKFFNEYQPSLLFEATKLSYQTKMSISPNERKKEIGILAVCLIVILSMKKE